MGRTADQGYTRPLAALLWATAAAFAQPADFRADVKLVRVAVTVKNAAGALVGSLDKDSFRIWDSGVKQEIAVFERSTALPLSIAVLLDASGSTAAQLPVEVAAIKTFLKSLVAAGNPKDSVALYAFNYQTTELAPFTRNLSRLSSGLSRVKGEAGTSLYDALHFAAADLEKRAGRKVIVVVTDGGDTTSTYTFRDALRAAHMAEASVYPILIRPVTNDPGRNVGGENALSSLAFGTGGRVFEAVLEEAALNQSLGALLKELRTQYLLGYYPRNLPPERRAWHEIRVEMLENGEPAPGLRPSARSGYYEDSPARRAER